MSILACLLVVLSAVAYRVRGSSLFSFTGGRALKLAIGSLPVALACLFFDDSWLIFFLIWLGTGAADSLPHAEDQGAADLDQIVMMALIGCSALLPAGLILAFGSFWGVYGALIVMSGAVTAAAYTLGNLIPCKVVGIRTGPELSELMNGGFRVLFVFLSFYRP